MIVYEKKKKKKMSQQISVQKSNISIFNKTVLTEIIWYFLKELLYLVKPYIFTL